MRTFRSKYQVFYASNLISHHMTRIPKRVLRLPRHLSNRYLVVVKIFFNQQMISVTTEIQHALKSLDIMFRFQLCNIPCHLEEGPTTCTSVHCQHKLDEEMDNPQENSQDLESYVDGVKCSECNLQSKEKLY